MSEQKNSGLDLDAVDAATKTDDAAEDEVAALRLRVEQAAKAMRAAIVE